MFDAIVHHFGHKSPKLHSNSDIRLALRHSHGFEHKCCNPFLDIRDVRCYNHILNRKCLKLQSKPAEVD
ncbi:hypothetical protein GBA52_024498 [Prunus armeniaca]|nr:hypothetical protein GBA52_024498 [Prunus armeniaca]